ALGPELRAGGARDEFDRGQSRLWRQHTIKDAAGVSAVLGAVGRIDVRLDVVVGVDEGDVLLNTAGPYPALVLLLGTSEPMGRGPFDGSKVQVVAVANHPHGHRLSQRAI